MFILIRRWSINEYIDLTLPTNQQTDTSSFKIYPFSNYTLRAGSLKQIPFFIQRIISVYNCIPWKGKF